VRGGRPSVPEETDPAPIPATASKNGTGLKGVDLPKEGRRGIASAQGIRLVELRGRRDERATCREGVPLTPRVSFKEIRSTASHGSGEEGRGEVLYVWPHCETGNRIVLYSACYGGSGSSRTRILPAARVRRLARRPRKDAGREVHVESPGPIALLGRDAGRSTSLSGYPSLAEGGRRKHGSKSRVTLHRSPLPRKFLWQPVSGAVFYDNPTAYGSKDAVQKKT